MLEGAAIEHKIELSSMLPLAFAYSSELTASVMALAQASMPTFRISKTPTSLVAP